MKKYAGGSVKLLTEDAHNVASMLKTGGLLDHAVYEPLRRLKL